MREEEVVSRNPNVMNGALAFTGTRVAVEIQIQHQSAPSSTASYESSTWDPARTLQVRPQS